MRKIINFKQANQILSQFIKPRPVGENYTLDKMRKLMDYLGNPQNNLKIIHVAGTSGKTSTCYYVASILIESGYKVGLTVSPHIEEVNERAQINLVPMPEADYCEALTKFLAIVEKSGLMPSYFELLMAFAYWSFNEQNVDYAVIEVGLGGLLDGSNVVSRPDKLCIITDIGLDHTNILGDTIEEIAYQKAGIIQSQNVVFINEQSEKVVQVIKKRCYEVEAELNIFDQDTVKGINLTRLMPFQRRNFQLAFRATDYVVKRDHDKTVSLSSVQKSLNIQVPARMEVVSYFGKTLILDGSHNEQKISSLVEAVQQKFQHKEIALLVSFSDSKQSSLLASLRLLRKVSRETIITEFNISQDEVRIPIRSSEIDEFAKEAGFKKIIMEPNYEKALLVLLNSKSEIGLVTGSFFLASNIRSVLKYKNSKSELSVERSKP